MEKALTALVGFLVGLLTGGSGGSGDSGEPPDDEGAWLNDQLAGVQGTEDRGSLFRRELPGAAISLPVSSSEQHSAAAAAEAPWWP